MVVELLTKSNRLLNKRGKGGDCVVWNAILGLVVLSVGLGVIIGFWIGYIMGCRKRGDYTK